MPQNGHGKPVINLTKQVNLVRIKKVRTIKTTLCFLRKLLIFFIIKSHLINLT